MDFHIEIQNCFNICSLFFLFFVLTITCIIHRKITAQNTNTNTITTNNTSSSNNTTRSDNITTSHNCNLAILVCTLPVPFSWFEFNNKKNNNNNHNNHSYMCNNQNSYDCKYYQQSAILCKYRQYYQLFAEVTRGFQQPHQRVCARINLSMSSKMTRNRQSTQSKMRPVHWVWCGRKFLTLRKINDYSYDVPQLQFETRISAQTNTTPGCSMMCHDSDEQAIKHNNNQSERPQLQQQQQQPPTTYTIWLISLCTCAFVDEIGDTDDDEDDIEENDEQVFNFKGLSDELVCYVGGCFDYFEFYNVYLNICKTIRYQCTVRYFGITSLQQYKNILNESAMFDPVINDESLKQALKKRLKFWQLNKRDCYRKKACMIDAYGLIVGSFDDNDSDNNNNNNGDGINRNRLFDAFHGKSDLVHRSLELLLINGHLQQVLQQLIDDNRPYLNCGQTKSRMKCILKKLKDYRPRYRYSDQFKRYIILLLLGFIMDLKSQSREEYKRGNTVLSNCYHLCLIRLFQEINSYCPSLALFRWTFTKFDENYDLLYENNWTTIAEKQRRFREMFVQALPVNFATSKQFCVAFLYLCFFGSKNSGAIPVDQRIADFEHSHPFVFHGLPLDDDNADGIMSDNDIMSLCDSLI